MSPVEASATESYVLLIGKFGLDRVIISFRKLFITCLTGFKYLL